MFCRVLLLVLLLTVPLQAVWGATGSLCAGSAHGFNIDVAAPHSRSDVAAPHSHSDDAGSITEHVHGPTPSHLQDSTGEPSTGDESLSLSGKCKVCSECCYTAALVPAFALSVFPPHPPLQVSSIVDPGMVSATGDELFRPPRTSTA